MTNVEYVKLLHNKESELIRICFYHGFIKNYMDIIQELYIKLLLLKNIDRYLLNNEPNMYIVFMIIKNMIYDYRKKESKYSYVELFDFPEDIEENEKFDFILNEINKIDDTKNWFDKKILELYVINNHSIRSLSKETNIGIHFIQPIIHDFKIRVKEKYDKIKKLKN